MSWEGKRAFLGARREGNNSGIPPHGILNCYPNPQTGVVFWQMSCTSHFKELLAPPVLSLGFMLHLARVLMYLCPEMGPRKTGHQESAYLAEFVYPDEFNLWLLRRMSASPGMSYVSFLVFFFTALRPYCIPSAYHKLLLSHLCRKQVHRAVLESRPWKPCGLRSWSGEVPVEQQICRAAAARFGRAGWGGDNVQSRVCHKRKYSLPILPHCVYFWCFSLKKLEV